MKAMESMKKKTSSSDWPRYLRRAHELMLARHSTRDMATALKVSLKTAANYRNQVNRRVGFNRPWENPPNPENPV